MQYWIALLALAASALASPAPQAVTSAISPQGSAPPGCESSYNGKFEYTVVKPQPAKRDLIEKRADCRGEGTLVSTLQNGVLVDGQGRTGYIASNYQFQFDKPPQAGAIYTSGFSVCGNGSIALGATTVFYQCLSGDFYNLYNKNWAAHCEPVALQVIPCGGSTSTTGASTPSVSASTPSVSATVTLPTVSQATDAQPTVTSAPTVSQQTDGQPTASSAVPISQLTDGQPQGISQIPDGQPQATSAAPVSQISDGQPQAGNATVIASPTQSVQPFTGAAAMPTVFAEFAAVVAGVAAVIAL